MKRQPTPQRSEAPRPATILIVDDEEMIRASLGEFLTDEGYVVLLAGSAEAAIDVAGAHAVDVILCDLQLPGMDGVECLDRLLRLHPRAFGLLITAYGTVETAVEAFKRGAQDYLLKPVLFDEVLAKIKHLVRFRDLHLENQWLLREVHKQQDVGQFVGRSPLVQKALAEASKVAATRSTVLIVGASGTGKELVARAIHQQGPNRDEKFIPVNCAAIPSDLLENQLFGHRKGAYTGADRDQEGVFVHVGKGTLFLDEVAEMTPATQAKLLRAIEHKEVLPVGAAAPVQVEARIVAATNKDLTLAVREGRFREDLYYRLNVVTIQLPSLRDRREDIPELVEFLLAKHSQALGRRFVGVEPEAMRLLQAATWKGNVRELENAIQRAVILGEGPLLKVDDLPPGLAPDRDACLSDDLRAATAHYERRHVERILRETPDKREAAKRLGLALSSLYRKIEELGIASAATQG